MLPADPASRAGSPPEASGDSSLGTLAKNMKPDFDLPTVIKIVESAFYRAADHDYRDSHVHNEEDMRTTTYRYIRDALDLAPLWRILVNPSAFGSVKDKGKHYKPDLVVFHWPPDKAEPLVRLLIEIKHWPDRDAILHDIEKLAEMKTHFVEDKPEVAFFAIVGQGFEHAEVEKMQRTLSQQYDAHVWLIPHFSDAWIPDHSDEEPRSLYKGPWRYQWNLDPWRARLKQKTQ